MAAGRQNEAYRASALSAGSHVGHLNARNTNGHAGVVFNKASGKWIAHITFKGVKHNRGSFVDKKDAIAAREAAESIHSDFLDAYYAKQQVPEDQLFHSNLVITARSGHKRTGQKHTSRTFQHDHVLSPCLMKGPDHEKHRSSQSASQHFCAALRYAWR